MNQVTQWLKSHMTAILSTAIVVSKSGALGTGASALITALAAACGALTP